jgi:hypothetical protein
MTRKFRGIYIPIGFTKSDTSMAAMNTARRAHNVLSENDKVESVRRRALVHHWADIPRDLKHTGSTIRSFYAKWQRNGCLQKLLGRPKAPAPPTAVIDLTCVEPYSTIRDVAARSGSHDAPSLWFPPL